MRARDWMWGLCLASVGCGGAGPELSNFRLSTEASAVGREVVALAHLFDPSGDMEQGRLHLRVEEEDGGMDLDGEGPVLDFAQGQQEGEVALAFTLSGAVPGRYKVTLRAESGAGQRSNEVQAPLRYVATGLSPAGLLGRR